MSLPHSKILKASKSILAVADLNHNSPSNQASQNVNVIVNSAPTNPEYSKNLKPSVEQKVAYPTNNGFHRFHLTNSRGNHTISSWY